MSRNFILLHRLTTAERRHKICKLDHKIFIEFLSKRVTTQNMSEKKLIILKVMGYILSLFYI